MKNSNQELEAKFKKYSKTQLIAKLEKAKDANEIEIIKTILTARGHQFAEDIDVPNYESVETPEAAPLVEDDLLGPEVPAETKEPKKTEKVSKKKVTVETAVTTSKDKRISGMIADLQTQVGTDLENLKADLAANGIDVPFIVFLNKGDVVEFDAAKNSQLHGQKLKGIVQRNNELDKAGRKYCRIKVEGHGTFQKAQTSVIRLEIAGEDLSQ